MNLAGGVINHSATIGINDIGLHPVLSDVTLLRASFYETIGTAMQQ